MRILVLGGGDSPEREVSLRSSAAVRDGLTDLGHDVIFADPADGDDTIIAAARDCTTIFPILHGVGGEDGTVQRLLETIGKPYLGSQVAASELCFNKFKLKELLRANQIATPRSELVGRRSFAKSALIRAPFALKPVEGGSSLDTLLARTLPFDQDIADGILTRYPKLLVEELIIGTEITVPVLGTRALPVIEIVPPSGGDFDYENKYNGATAELCPPRSIDRLLQRRAQDVAERIHKLAGARHLSRTDIMVDTSGNLLVLEINTMPGMTAQSLFPKAAAASGLSWTALMNEFVEMVAGSR